MEKAGDLTIEHDNKNRELKLGTNVMLINTHLCMKFQFISYDTTV